MYMTLKALYITSPVVLSYSTMIYKNGTKAEQHFIDRIAVMEILILVLDAYLRIVRSDPVSKL